MYNLILLGKKLPKTKKKTPKFCATNQHIFIIRDDEMDDSQWRIFEDNIGGVIIYLTNKKR